MKFTLISFGLFLAAVLSCAASTPDDAYFRIGELKIREVPAPKNPPFFLNWKGAGPSLPSVDTIINLGKTAWDLIAANKPVAHAAADYANGLPSGTYTWEQIQGWQTPVVREIEVVYTNQLGAEVIRFHYRVSFSYGGNIDGVGRYLANVMVEPAQLSVAWGYTFNAQNRILQVLNAGSSADPIAAMQLSVAWTVDTVVAHEQMSDTFEVRGDGGMSASVGE